ncbi:MAG: transporter related protein [Panacagrimonas sp.]|jgi:ATP-binding cassette subfamily C protein|nr:ABC transporter ATP-binding protein [Panacagrimonas sp.]MCC2657155.1 transporter related protein [Panacagrimonas sp.]
MTQTAATVLTSVASRGAFPMMAAFVRAYPGRSALALLAVFVAGLLDGLGLSLLLSMLTLTDGVRSADPSLPEKVALAITDFLGIPVSAPNLLALAVGLISLKAVLTLLANRQVGFTVAYIATDLRLAMIRAVMKARWRYYLQQSLGRLAHSVAGEASRAADGFQNSAEMAAMILNSFIYLGIAMTISPVAGLAAILAGAILLLVLRRLIRKSRRAAVDQTRLLQSLVAVISGQLSAAKPLKAMAREEHVDALLSDQTRKLKKALRQQVIAKEAVSALQEPLLAIMVSGGFFLSLYVLELPLASVLVMLFLIARVVSYLSKAQKAFVQVSLKESAYWSIVQGIEQARSQPEPTGGDRVVELEKGIRFEDVSFGHGTARGILDHQSLEIPAGALTVFIGPSGAGKTTMLDLLVGLLRPDEGRILVDDVPLDELNLRAWRRQIGYVPQESVMVDESVAYNLTLGEQMSEDDIREALRAADALDFVSAMPEGWNTRVGEGGSRLSGGQRQRLAIARALIHKPRLLILDEATSNLDHEAQSAVIETVNHLRGKLTILAVAHQERMVREADRVYRLAAGRVSETAPTERLIPVDG